MCKGTADVTPNPGAPFVICDICVDGEFTIRADQQWKLCGFPGQEPSGLPVTVQMLTVDGEVVIEAESRRPMGTNCWRLADFLAAVEHGWLVPL